MEREKNWNDETTWSVDETSSHSISVKVVADRQRSIPSAECIATHSGQLASLDG
jgi:hypothetical protein